MFLHIQHVPSRNSNYPLRGMAPDLLITVDAFGTLYEPRELVPQQYVDVAAQHGLDGLDATAVESSFRQAFKEQLRTHPIYGRETGMTPQTWWAQITEKTFTPLLKPQQTIPPALHAALWTHFSSSAGYHLFPDTLDFFAALTEFRQSVAANPWQFRTVTLGVLSNSDDRVIDILTSLGIAVRHRSRVTTDADSKVILDRMPADANTPFYTTPNAVDFVTTSHAVGSEKPDSGIFLAAMASARELLVRRNIDGEPREWAWVHVGDNPVEDVAGAEAVGAVGVLLNRERGLLEVRRRVMVGETMQYVLVTNSLRNVLNRRLRGEVAKRAQTFLFASFFWMLLLLAALRLGRAAAAAHLLRNGPLEVVLGNPALVEAALGHLCGSRLGLDGGDGGRADALGLGQHGDDPGLVGEVSAAGDDAEDEQIQEQTAQHRQHSFIRSIKHNNSRATGWAGRRLGNRDRAVVRRVLRSPPILQAEHEAELEHDVLRVHIRHERKRNVHRPRRLNLHRDLGRGQVPQDGRAVVLAQLAADSLDCNHVRLEVRHLDVHAGDAAVHDRDAERGVVVGEGDSDFGVEVTDFGFVGCGSWLRRREVGVREVGGDAAEEAEGEQRECSEHTHGGQSIEW
ncbi:hypothetical protein Dda_4711 [Drechslerella dactyloides]|uniref:Haloacid dehalogenase-like hydrolase n=1 Tax=Drechslerella dactyloides TaxID=74499 RepID=A0AAD6NJL9_DREDA|nr:hypothetical protein Dda_4711 [Drechslerella dactyloides]